MAETAQAEWLEELVMLVLVRDLLVADLVEH